MNDVEGTKLEIGDTVVYDKVTYGSGQRLAKSEIFRMTKKNLILEDRTVRSSSRVIKIKGVEEDE